MDSCQIHQVAPCLDAFVHIVHVGCLSSFPHLPTFFSFNFQFVYKLIQLLFFDACVLLPHFFLPAISTSCTYSCHCIIMQ